MLHKSVKPHKFYTRKKDGQICVLERIFNTFQKCRFKKKNTRGIHKGDVSEFPPEMRNSGGKAVVREGSEAGNDRSVDLIDKMGPMRLINR